jgi:hypothetical protein
MNLYHHTYMIDNCPQKHYVLLGIFYLCETTSNHYNSSLCYYVFPNATTTSFTTQTQANHQNNS